MCFTIHFGEDVIIKKLPYASSPDICITATIYRSLKAMTSSQQQTHPETTNSRATKSPQRSFGLLGRSSGGGGGGKKSPSPRPPSLSSSKMVEVQNWVHSTNAATAMVHSLSNSPPSGMYVHNSD